MVDIRMENTLLDSRVFDRKERPFAPGMAGNSPGRPPNYGSITYWLKQLLAENEGKRARDIAAKAIEIAQSGSLPHLNLVLDRSDGAIASEINVKGVFLHVGDEYAAQGLAAMREDMSVKQLEASQMPQISVSSPTNAEKGMVGGVGDNGTSIIDE